MADTVTPMLPAEVPAPRTSLVVRFAERFGMEPAKMLDTLKATAFRTDKPITNEQLASLMLVAERYDLDPFVKELYAYVDHKRGGAVIPVVGYDGWVAMINRHPQFDGMEIVPFDSKEQAQTVTIHRKDRKVPTTLTEFLVECRRDTDPWRTGPRRMIRNRTVIQCARLAFGFSGLRTEDEAREMTSSPLHAVPLRPASNAERIDKALDTGEVIENDPQAPAAPEAPTLPDYLQQMREAADPWVAEMIVEEAREYLSGDELDELAHAFSRKFPNDPETEGAESE